MDKLLFSNNEAQGKKFELQLDTKDGNNARRTPRHFLIGIKNHPHEGKVSLLGLENYCPPSLQAIV